MGKEGGEVVTSIIEPESMTDEEREAFKEHSVRALKALAERAGKMKVPLFVAVVVDNELNEDGTQHTLRGSNLPADDAAELFKHGQKLA